MDQSAAAKADRIFELTALGEDDIICETAAAIISRELKGIVFLFSGFLEDGHIHPDSVPFYETLVKTAQQFSADLLFDPHKVSEYNDGDMPLYLAASELCLDVVDIIGRIDLQPEWRHHYDEQCKRLKFFALILKEDPANTIRSV